jgi:hypothetical protein
MLILFKKTVALCYEIHNKCINTLQSTVGIMHNFLPIDQIAHIAVALLWTFKCPPCEKKSEWYSVISNNTSIEILDYSTGGHNEWQMNRYLLIDLKCVVLKQYVRLWSTSLRTSRHLLPNVRYLLHYRRPKSRQIEVPAFLRTYPLFYLVRVSWFLEIREVHKAELM